jgi:hypothetical protein
MIFVAVMNVIVIENVKLISIHVDHLNDVSVYGLEVIHYDDDLDSKNSSYQSNKSALNYPVNLISNDYIDDVDVVNHFLNDFY